MKFSKEWVPAYRGNFVTMVKNNGERVPWYLPYSYRSAEQAQAECDKRNRFYKHGKLEVEFTDYPAAWAFRGRIKF